jgi:hypothetical protein
MQTHLKRMRCLTYLGETPPSLVRTSISSPCNSLLVDCTARVNSVPPKESTLAFKTWREDASPKLPLTTVAEHDPIYPLFKTSCSDFSFRQ